MGLTIRNGKLKRYTEESGVTEITIPDGVTKIGESAFDSCTSLTSVTIPDSVIRISESAFADCTNLSEIILGEDSHFVVTDGALWTKDKQTKIIELAK